MNSACFKRLTALVICIVCVLCSAVVCGAVSQTYTIPDIDDLSITLPDGMTAVTRNSNKNDRYFSVIGLDYDTTMNNFKKGNIYLQGMDESSTTTVTVTMTKTEESKGIKNYTLLDAEKLTEVEGNFLSHSEYSSCTPDQSADKKIVWFLFNTNVNASGNSIKAYQAHTVYDGMSVNITLQRNGSDVTDADFNTFSTIVSTISFGKESSIQGLVPVMIIGGAVILIILIILLIFFIRHIRIRGKKSKNNQILSELADKYKLEKNGNNKNNDVESDDRYLDISGTDSVENVESSDYIESEMFGEELEEEMKSIYDEDGSLENTDMFRRLSDDRMPSDDEIDEILSSAHSYDDNTGYIVYSEQDTNESAQEIAEDVTPDVEQEQAEAEPQQTEELEKSVDEPDAEYDDEPENENSDDDESEYEDESDENADLTEDGLTELDEFNNDEELVREQATKTKFTNSYDYFDEAPKKTMGIISNKELDDAEDYDVINEIEQRASFVEEDYAKDADAGVPIGERLQKIGNGFKNFGVHFGYFCTNVSRMIKRKRAIKKRKKAEQARIERQRARAERERQQRRAGADGSLVQVHSRNERRPKKKRGAPARRPAPTQRRRPSGSNARRPLNQSPSRNRRPDNRPRR